MKDVRLCNVETISYFFGRILCLHLQIHPEDGGYGLCGVTPCGILQYYCSCFCFSQQVTRCPGMSFLHPLYCVCLCMCICVNLSVITFGQVKKVSCKIV